MKKTFIIFVLFTLFSCNDGSDLGDDYYYLPDYEALDIGYAYGTMVYKSENKNHFNDVIVYSDIKNIKFNSEYIIVLQEPNKKLMIKQIADDLTTWNNYYLENKKDSVVNLTHGKLSLKNIDNLIKENKSRRLDKIADSIFNKESFYKKIFKNKENYYIIQKENDSIFGPLNLKEFTKIKNKKNIDLDFN